MKRTEEKITIRFGGSNRKYNNQWTDINATGDVHLLPMRVSMGSKFFTVSCYDTPAIRAVMANHELKEKKQRKDKPC